MTRKAILKLAGYEVKQYPPKKGNNWYWEINHTGESAPFFHKTETRSWTNAWLHFKRHNTPKESNT